MAIVKRILHALVWLIAISIAGAIIGLMCEAVFSHWDSELSSFIAALVVFPAIISVWIVAIVRRWPLFWPTIFILAFWPFGLWIIGAIGLGKFIIHGYGRDGLLYNSDLEEPISEARPRGLLEHTSYEQ